MAYAGVGKVNWLSLLSAHKSFDVCILGCDNRLVVVLCLYKRSGVCVFNVLVSAMTIDI